MNLRKTALESDSDGNSSDVFGIVLELVQELRSLQDANYAGTPLQRFVN